MEMTLERLKAVIGDQTCQIHILQTEKAQIIKAYNELIEENKKLKVPKKKAKRVK